MLRRVPHQLSPRRIVGHWHSHQTIPIGCRQRQRQCKQSHNPQTHPKKTIYCDFRLLKRCAHGNGSDIGFQFSPFLLFELVCSNEEIISGALFVDVDLPNECVVEWVRLPDRQSLSCLLYSQGPQQSWLPNWSACVFTPYIHPNPYIFVSTFLHVLISIHQLHVVFKLSNASRAHDIKLHIQ